MAVYQPIKEKRQFSNSRITEMAYTSGYLTCCNINNLIRLNPIYYLQSALYRI